MCIFYEAPKEKIATILKEIKEQRQRADLL